MARSTPLGRVIEELPEPIRCIALGLVDDLMAQGFARAHAERSAAELAVSFAAERMWDVQELEVEWLILIDATCSEGDALIG